jgi:hypothetical protein
MIELMSHNDVLFFLMEDPALDCVFDWVGAFRQNPSSALLFFSASYASPRRIDLKSQALTAPSTPKKTSSPSWRTHYLSFLHHQSDMLKMKGRMGQTNPSFIVSSGRPGHRLPGAESSRDWVHVDLKGVPEEGSALLGRSVTGPEDGVEGSKEVVRSLERLPAWLRHL